MVLMSHRQISGICCESTHCTGWNNYYMFEDQCNQSDIQGWVRLMLLNVMVVQVLLYRVEVWGGTVSRSAWSEKFKHCSYVDNWQFNPQHPTMSCF